MTPKEEIRATIKQFFHAMDTQNLPLMQQLIPHDTTTIHIGTEDDEIWKGWPVLHEATKVQFQNLEYYKATIRDLSITVGPSKRAGWYFHLLDAEIKSADTITTFEGARFTGVVQKENSHWVLAQTHVSLPEDR